ncbi:MAG TPA: transglutaminaseTgpA domain-containing protein, partial [Pirellulales bacterium]|nr:transglutaminaseTgpA domain-containing protein [Pirellulales bacterium]
MQNKSAESLVRLLIAVLIITATMLLGIGERSAQLTCISLVAVAVSAYVTDTKKLFRLNQGWADAAAVAIVFIASVNAYSMDRHGLMVAAADLQSYLQYVLLFQAKTARVYWQLALLSLGQVAIASTLVPGPTFGVGLLFYLLVGIATFALLVASMDQDRFAESLASSPTISAASEAPVSGKVVLWGASPPATDLNLSLCKQSVLIAMVTVGVTALIFFLIPRWNVRNGEATVTEAIAEVGFSKKVTLGELGVVVNNPDLVMRVQFFTSHGKAPFKLAGEPLWRGTVVRRYADGEWSQSMPASPVALREDPPAPYVRQSITVEPLDVNELFCVFPVFALQKEPQLLIDYNYDQLVRHEDARGHRMPLDLATTGIVDDKQRQFL